MEGQRRITPIVCLQGQVLNVTGLDSQQAPTLGYHSQRERSWHTEISMF